MLNKFRRNLTEVLSRIENREYNNLAEYTIDVPDEFNWVGDVFEPLIVHRYADHIMLELAHDHQAETSTITYRQGVEKCNQLLNFFRKKGVEQGNDIFVMCGLSEGLWITYLTATKGGFIMIPAASILSVNDILYRFHKASPKVIITDKENAEKMEQALLQYPHAVKVKILLDADKDGWNSYSDIDTEAKEANAANTKKDDDLFWFFTSGTTGMPKVVEHTQASYP